MLASFQTRFQQLAMTTADALADPLESPVSSADPKVLALFRQQPLERLAQYQWMVYANHAETLEAIYPYCYRLLQPQWEVLVRRYLERCPPKSYQLYDMATGFPQFLSTEGDWLNRYPFLTDLADYELLEATLLRFAEPKEAFTPSKTALLSPQGDELDRFSPQMNPVAQSFTSVYPLEEIVGRLRETEEDEALPPLPVETVTPLFLWVYRDKAFNCRFFKVNPFIQTFLNSGLHIPPSAPASYAALLAQTCKVCSIELTPAIAHELAEFLPQLIAVDILWGSLPYGIP